MTWVDGDLLYWSLRTGGAWSEPDWRELTTSGLPEDARRAVRESLGLGVQPRHARTGAPDRRLPAFPALNRPRR